MDEKTFLSSAFLRDGDLQCLCLCVCVCVCVLVLVLGRARARVCVYMCVCVTGMRVHCLPADVPGERRALAKQLRTFRAAPCPPAVLSLCAVGLRLAGQGWKRVAPMALAIRLLTAFRPAAGLRVDAAALC